MCNQCVPSEKKPVPHVHAEIMKKWADDTSQIVEYRTNPDARWQYTGNPSWFPHYEYRIRPASKPDIVQYIRSTPGYSSEPEKARTNWFPHANNIQKQTFDGETGQLKSVEIVK